MLHYRFGDGGDGDLLAYTDIQRDFLRAIEDEPDLAEDAIDDLIGLLTAAIAYACEKTGADPLKFWRHVAGRLAEQDE
jgi:hypothetical protein